MQLMKVALWFPETFILRGVYKGFLLAVKKWVYFKNIYSWAILLFQAKGCLRHQKLENTKVEPPYKFCREHHPAYTLKFDI